MAPSVGARLDPRMRLRSSFRVLFLRSFRGARVLYILATRYLRRFRDWCARQSVLFKSFFVRAVLFVLVGCLVSRIRGCAGRLWFRSGCSAAAICSVCFVGVRCGGRSSVQRSVYELHLCDVRVGSVLFVSGVWMSGWLLVSCCSLVLDRYFRGVFGVQRSDWVVCPVAVCLRCLTCLLRRCVRVVLVGDRLRCRLVDVVACLRFCCVCRFCGCSCVVFGGRVSICVGACRVEGCPSLPVLLSVSTLIRIVCGVPLLISLSSYGMCDSALVFLSVCGVSRVAIAKHSSVSLRSRPWRLLTIFAVRVSRRRLARSVCVLCVSVSGPRFPSGLLRASSSPLWFCWH